MIRKYYFLVFSLILICLGARAQSVQPVAHLDSGTIKIGEQVKLHLTVHQPRAVKVSFPLIADSIVSKIGVVSQNKPDTTSVKGDNVNITVDKVYTITGFDEGTYTIPEYKFAVGKDTVKSNPVSLVIQTVKVDTTKAIYDIKQPLAVSYTFWDWLRDHWVWVLIGWIILLIIAGVIWYLRTRPKKEVVVEEVKPDVPLYLQYLTKLQQLRDKKLYQSGEIKAYHSELTDIIREYLEKRYAIKTHEKTSDEILASMKYVDIAEENRTILRQILLLADLVKFAKEKPSASENDLSLEKAINFVTSTRQQVVQPIKPTEGGSNGNPV